MGRLRRHHPGTGMNRMVGSETPYPLVLNMYCIFHAVWLLLGHERLGASMESSADMNKVIREEQACLDQR
jgi:hypothetical protein